MSSCGTVDQMSVQPTPEHHHKRIARVIHSEPAAPCEQGASNLMGRVEVTNHFRYTCRDHASGLAAAAVFGSNTRHLLSGDF